MPTKRGIIISPMNVGDILLNTNSTIIGINVLGRVIFATPTVKDLFGYTVKELMGQDLTCIIPERFRSMHKAGFTRWAETGQLSVGGREMRMSGLRKDGTEVPIALVLGSFYTEDGDLRAVATIKNIQDILDLEQKQRETQSELDYIRSITNNLRDTIIVTDKSGCITFANSVAIKMLGLEDNGYLGKSAHNLFHANRPDGSYIKEEDCSLHMAIAQNETVISKDDWVQRRDGTFINVSITTTPLWQGEISVGGVNVYEDISIEKKWRENLEASEKKYRELVELSPDPIAVHQNGKFVFANQACLDLMKATTLDDIKDMSILDFIHPDYHELVKARVGHRMAIGQRLELAQEKGIDLEGNIIDIEVATMPIIYEGKDYILTIIRNVSDRIRLEEVNAYLAAIVDGSATPIIGKNLDGTITSWNLASERTYGWPKEDAIGRHISLVVPLDKREELDWIMKTLRSGHPIENLETERIDRYGQRIPVTLHVSPIRNKAGKIIGASSIATPRVKKKNEA